MPFSLPRRRSTNARSNDSRETAASAPSVVLALATVQPQASRHTVNVERMFFSSSTTSTRDVVVMSGALFGDHEIFDLVVGRLRDDLARHELIFLRVGPAGDDLLRVRVADAGQRHELVGG